MSPPWGCKWSYDGPYKCRGKILGAISSTMCKYNRKYHITQQHSRLYQQKIKLAYLSECSTWSNYKYLGLHGLNSKNQCSKLSMRNTMPTASVGPIIMVLNPSIIAYIANMVSKEVHKDKDMEFSPVVTKLYPPRVDIVPFPPYSRIIEINALPTFCQDVSLWTMGHRLPRMHFYYNYLCSHLRVPLPLVW